MCETNNFLEIQSPGGGGGTPGNFWQGCARPLLQILTRFQTKKCNFPSPFLDQAPVVQTSDSAIHRINHYPADSVIDFRNTYPLDSDLSGG